MLFFNFQTALILYVGKPNYGNWRTRRIRRVRETYARARARSVNRVLAARPVNQSPIERESCQHRRRRHHNGPFLWCRANIHPISRYVRLISKTIRNPFTVPWKSDCRTMRQLYFVIARIHNNRFIYLSFSHPPPNTSPPSTPIPSLSCV